MKWKPIETAPNDGEYFICWNGKEMAILNQPPRCYLGKWNKTHDGCWHGSFERFDNPTHWRGLPTPPKADIKKK